MATVTLESTVGFLTGLLGIISLVLHFSCIHGLKYGKDSKALIIDMFATSVICNVTAASCALWAGLNHMFILLIWTAVMISLGARWYTRAARFIVDRARPEG